MQKDNLDQWEGIVEHITFRNEESGYAVLRLKNDDKDVITIVGSLASVQPGEMLCCWGKWKMDKRYGKQLEVQWFESRVPSTLIGVERYLASGLIKGIGAVMAKRIVHHFGAKALEILDDSPQRLREVSGIGKKTLEKIVAGWKQQHSLRRVMIWLQNYGISPTFAQRIYKEYGDESIRKMEENPYRMTYEMIGVGFKIADDIAQKMGVAPDSPTRVQSAIEYNLYQYSLQGHTCCPAATLVQSVIDLLNVSDALIQEQLASLSYYKKIVIQTMILNDAIESFIWGYNFYTMEQRITLKIEQMIAEPCDNALPDDQALQPIRDIAQTLQIQLERQQELAVWYSTILPIHIITGGPGTGKSTIIKTLTRYLEAENRSFLLAAPTGRAAKRLSEITQREVVTLHSLLGFSAMNKNAFAANAPVLMLRADVLIVDEASMLDTILFNTLLRALENGTRLILVGDIDQLPSVGAGSILTDIIQSGRVQITRLTEIFRQAQSSQIIINAHKINKGEYLTTKVDKNSDFFFISKEATDEIQQTLLSLLAGRLEKTYGLDILREVQVLSPMNKGELGTIRLNEMIQQVLNPLGAGKNSLERGKTLFIEGDKVLQTRNNYEKGVYNGDIGYIESIDTEEKTLYVRIDKEQVEYTTEDWQELELAYAISVHKYQGSECPCVIIPLHSSHFKLLSRNLVYTAVTRGKKLVILLGMERALRQAIDNNSETKRFTGLQQALTYHSKQGFPPIVIVPMEEPIYKV